MQVSRQFSYKLRCSFGGYSEQ